MINKRGESEDLPDFAFSNIDVVPKYRYNSEEEILRELFKEYGEGHYYMYYPKKNIHNLWKGIIRENDNEIITRVVEDKSKLDVLGMEKLARDEKGEAKIEKRKTGNMREESWL